MKKIPLTVLAIYGGAVFLVGGIMWAAVASNSTPAIPSAPLETNAAASTNTEGSSSRASKELVLSCTMDMYTTFHIHPYITIFLDGVRQTIPTDIGITNGCMKPIHTHDATGKIHVESPEKKDFTLGDFFLVWGKPFDVTHLLDRTADDAHRIVMTVNGVTNTTYQDYVFQDADDIVLRYQSK